MTEKELGTIGESVAAEYLEEKGYRILERNFTACGGEIDVIAEKGDTLVFVEVKTRRSGNGAIAAIDERKLKRMLKCADRYLYEKELCGTEKRFRFDAVEVYTDGNARDASNTRIRHIENLDVDLIR